jgi:hypothetical protein
VTTCVDEREVAGVAGVNGESVVGAVVADGVVGV